MRHPKIIVIMPTRERCDVLASSLATATIQDYDNLEIIVSDNCSQDQTRDVVAANNDPRIRYVNTGERCSMSHNWEFALSHARDGWVTFMGDDDGLIQGAIAKVADIVASTSAEAVRSRFCTYDWPTMIGKSHGRLIVPMGTGVESRSTAHWLKRSLLGFAKYTELPMVYNGGFIHTRVFDAIRASSGARFNSSIPDVYSAVSVASVIERYVFTHEPLSISGTSRHSTGNSFNSAQKDRNTAPALKFSAEGNIPFHSDLPMNSDGTYPRALHALVYESYLQTQLLRDRPSTTSHEQQLEIIMASATPHRESIREWGRLFAELHGIDYPRGLRGAFVRRMLVGPYALGVKIINAANSVILDGPATPITDVYQASIAATTIRARARRRHSLPHLLKEHLAGNA